VAPTIGHSVSLTLNSELQEICDRALADAVARMGAVGGDIVMLNPHDGAILAVASRRLGSRVAASTAFTEPFEPGSTLKPFTAAALLTLGRARPGDRMRTLGGTWSVHGRTITDEHPADVLTLAEVIGQSSNIGIARFAERMTPGEQFEALRDFGFGTPTGVPYPSEAAGTLRAPAQWSRLSSASLAMGYEIAVTPIQLAAAYASIANGGELLEPSLVKEIREPDGSVRYRHERRVVRRVMSPAVAAEIRRMLIGVVKQGTARRAELSTFAVAGKTGTARRFVGGSYAEGQYTASFVGLFPADDPQYVIVVKLDDPKDSFGGQTAAPVTKVILEAAIAAPRAALDRGSLARLASAARLATAGDAGAIADADDTVRSDDVEPAGGRADTADPGATPHVVTLAARRTAPAVKPQPRPVPDVRGLPLRSAVRTLHRAGFRVKLAAGDGATLPAAGTVAPAGMLVRLNRDR
jgi:cell division protein FtsI (penicillin-binding protein 3)